MEGLFFDGLIVDRLMEERGDVVVVQCQLMTGLFDVGQAGWQDGRQTY